MFYFIVFYSTLTERPVKVKNINVLEKLRGQVVYERKGKKPIQILSHKHFAKLYGLVFLLIGSLCIFIVIGGLLGDFVAWEKSESVFLPALVTVVFLLINVSMILWLSMVVLGLFLHPVDKVTEIVLDDGTIVSVDMIKCLAVARRADRVLLGEWGSKNDPSKVKMDRAIRREIDTSSNGVTYGQVRAYKSWAGKLYQRNDQRTMLFLVTGLNYERALAFSVLGKVGEYLRQRYYHKKKGFELYGMEEWTNECQGYFDELTSLFSDTDRLTMLKDEVGRVEKAMKAYVESSRHQLSVRREVEKVEGLLDEKRKELGGEEGVREEERGRTEDVKIVIATEEEEGGEEREEKRKRQKEERPVVKGGGEGEDDIAEHQAIYEARKERKDRQIKRKRERKRGKEKKLRSGEDVLMSSSSSEGEEEDESEEEEGEVERTTTAGALSPPLDASQSRELDSYNKVRREWARIVGKRVAGGSGGGLKEVGISLVESSLRRLEKLTRDLSMDSLMLLDISPSREEGKDGISRWNYDDSKGVLSVLVGERDIRATSLLPLDLHRALWSDSDSFGEEGSEDGAFEVEIISMGEEEGEEEGEEGEQLAEVEGRKRGGVFLSRKRKKRWRKRWRKR